MVVIVPFGSDDDPTRSSDYYDGTFQFLKKCGIDAVVVNSRHRYALKFLRRAGRPRTGAAVEPPDGETIKISFQITDLFRMP